MKAIHLTAISALAFLLPACSTKPPDFFSGYAEADYVRLAASVSGTLTSLSVHRGDKVAIGAPAFILEQENERAAREEAMAHVQRAQAQLADLKKGKRPDEVAAVQAQLAQAETALHLAASELQRQKQLLAAKFIAPSSMDTARAAVENAQGHVNDLRAQLRVAKLGARSDEISAAEQDVNAAQSQLAQASWVLTQKNQRIPIAADVADVLYREGEWVAAGSPVVSLLPAQNIKARFFVSETVLGKLSLGQDVSLHCDGCGPDIPAKISFISHDAEYTAPLIYSKENRSALVFMLEARPAAADALRLHPGQPLEIRLADAKAHQ